MTIPILAMLPATTRPHTGLSAFGVAAVAATTMGMATTTGEEVIRTGGIGMPAAKVAMDTAVEAAAVAVTVTKGRSGRWSTVSRRYYHGPMGLPSTEIRMTGDNSKNLDNAERADLLCFLVLSQLIGHASTGNWLRTDHVVEATRMWLASNSAECGWFERVKLAQLSVVLAPQFLVFPLFRDAKKMVQLFVDGWQLDYRSSTVRGMLDVCADHLVRGR